MVENRLGGFQLGFFDDRFAGFVVGAIFFEKKKILEDLRQFLAFVAGVDNRSRQGGADPGGASFDESLLSGRFLFERNDGCDLVFGVGKKTIRPESEVTPAFEHGTDHRGLMIIVRGIREAQAGHDFQVDPVLFLIEDFP